MIEQKYILELPRREKDFAINRAVQDTVDAYFDSILKSLDCTRWNKTHTHRLMQTIGYDYMYLMGQAHCLIEEFNLDDTYKTRLDELHESNLAYELTVECEVYDKKKGLVKPKSSKTSTPKEKKPKVDKAQAKLAKRAAKLNKLVINIKPI